MLKLKLGVGNLNMDEGGSTVTENVHKILSILIDRNAVGHGSRLSRREVVTASDLDEESFKAALTYLRQALHVAAPISEEELWLTPSGVEFYETMLRPSNQEYRSLLQHWTGFRGILTPTVAPIVIGVVGLLVSAIGIYFGVAAAQDLPPFRETSAPLNATALQAYLARMTDLLLDESLREPNLGSGDVLSEVSLTAQAQAFGRAHTLAILTEVNQEQQKEVLRFLHNSTLISRNSKVVTIMPFATPPRLAFLQDANLSRADLTGLELPRVNLHGVTLTEANLSGANLLDADLSNTILTDANLTNAKLRSAVLCGATLSNASLVNADLTGAHLLNASFRGADFTNSLLDGANLSDANLPENKDLDLCSSLAIVAQPRVTDLRDAKVTNEQLAQASSLVGAIMPNGTEMTQECWAEFKKGEFQCASP